VAYIRTDASPNEVLHHPLKLHPPARSTPTLNPDRPTPIELPKAVHPDRPAGSSPKRCNTAHRRPK
jgi:hypothetical protein